ncbi:MAG: DmsE family decaheme c-type cytochrome [Myxococcota bacterium]|nr:DmsE family decaheme c-type cytochrome [Myxococcota bacterium]
MNSRAVRRLGVLLVAGAAWWAASAPAQEDQDPAPTPAIPVAVPAPVAENVGRETCQMCHRQETAHWDPTVHGRVFSSEPRTEKQALLCEACHGPGSLHQQDPRNPEFIIGFTRSSATSVERMNATCLACHAGGERIHWRGSVHETVDLACSDCHNPMSQESVFGLEAQVSASQTCMTCHTQQRVDFRKRSHMPLHEGKISCTDCHNPHGSATEPLLRADSVNQLCYSCHADKRGPFLWEHAPVVDNCLNCHLPHGSNHEALLAAAPPFLCQNCHAQAGGFGHPGTLPTSGNLAAGAFPDPRVLGRGCVTCHVQVHGSNHPSGARFHR